MDNLINKIKESIQPILENENVELYSIKYESTILEILIDSPNGIDIDKCVSVSEKISKLLDKLDPIEEEYCLEVASAGSERPINSKEDYLNNIDKFILVHTKKLYEGYDELVGYLREYYDDHIVLEIKIKTRVLKINIDANDIIDASTCIDL